MKKYALSLLLLSSIGLTSCSLFENDHIPKQALAPASCSTEDYNQYIYDVMKRYYFWYDEVDPFNAINPRDLIAYPDPYILLDTLKYSTLDRFSGISDAANFSAFYGDGVFLGTGLRLMFDDITGDVMIAYAYVGSPAYLAGIRRGDRIVEINGTLANGLSGDAWNTAWGADEVGTEVTLLIEHPDGTTETVVATKQLVSMTTTQHSAVIDLPGKKVGYLNFLHFLGNTAINQLSDQFSQFASAGINELVVDLRYNGGGAVDTARYLASLIGGIKTTKSVFSKLLFNDNPQGYNGHREVSHFYLPEGSLNLSRVVFITTGASCSASELLINSLIPNAGIDVVVVGSATCGKPVGSSVQTHCDKSLTAINFEIVNANDQGRYFAGIDAGYTGLTAFCSADDDLTSAIGSGSETSLATALDYISNSTCAAVPKSGTRRLREISPTITNNRSIPHDVNGLY